MIFGSQLVASIALLGTTILHYCVEENWPVIVLCWIANVGCYVSFSCAYSITKELFPTPLRYLKQKYINRFSIAHCRKIPQNVAFEFLSGNTV